MDEAGPFARLGGGPGDDGQAVQPPLMARFAAARERLAVAAVSAAARCRAGSGNGSGSGSGSGGSGESGGGGNGAAAHLLDGDQPEEEVATMTAPRPKTRTLGERLQLLKDALGDALAPAPDEEKNAAAAAPGPPLTLAAAARARHLSLLPEAAARLLSRDDDGVPVAFTCPLTLELMADPVVAPDGHTYERKAIEDWVASFSSFSSSRGAGGGGGAAAAAAGKRAPTSPMTGEPLVARARRPVALVTNRVLASAILEWGERALRARGEAVAAGVAAPP